MGDVDAGSSKLACDSCGEEFCLFWCAGPTDGSGRREATTEPVEPCDSCGKVPCLFWCAGPTDGSGRREVFTPPTNAMRDMHANAAEQRANDAALNGIGDSQALSELERETVKQEAAGTRSFFGASAALRLRKTLARTKHESVNSEDKQPATGVGPVENAEPTSGGSSSVVRHDASIMPVVAGAAASSSSASGSSEGAPSCAWCLREHGVTTAPGSARCRDLQREFGCHKCGRFGCWDAGCTLFPLPRPDVADAPVATGRGAPHMFERTPVRIYKERGTLNVYVEFSGLVSSKDLLRDLVAIV